MRALVLAMLLSGCGNLDVRKLGKWVRGGGGPTCPSAQDAGGGPSGGRSDCEVPR